MSRRGDVPCTRSWAQPLGWALSVGAKAPVNSSSVHLQQRVGDFWLGHARTRHTWGRHGFNRGSWCRIAAAVTHQLLDVLENHLADAVALMGNTDLAHAVPPPGSRRHTAAGQQCRPPGERTGGEDGRGGGAPPGQARPSKARVDSPSAAGFCSWSDQRCLVGWPSRTGMVQSWDRARAAESQVGVNRDKLQVPGPERGRWARSSAAGQARVLGPRGTAGAPPRGAAHGGFWEAASSAVWCSPLSSAWQLGSASTRLLRSPIWLRQSPQRSAACPPGRENKCSPTAREWQSNRLQPECLQSWPSCLTCPAALPGSPARLFVAPHTAGRRTTSSAVPYLPSSSCSTRRSWMPPWSSPARSWNTARAAVQQHVTSRRLGGDRAAVWDRGWCALSAQGVGCWRRGAARRGRLGGKCGEQGGRRRANFLKFFRMGSVSKEYDAMFW